jgi:hypothetical protein
MREIYATVLVLLIPRSDALGIVLSPTMDIRAGLFVVTYMVLVRLGQTIPHALQGCTTQITGTVPDLGQEFFVCEAISLVNIRTAVRNFVFPRLDDFK